MNRNQTNTTYVELLNDVGLSVRNYTLSVMRNPSKHIPNRFNDDSTAYECTLTDLENEQTMEFSFYKGSAHDPIDSLSANDARTAAVDTMETMLWEVLDNSYDDFESFCDEFGYDSENDDIDAFRIYDELVQMREKVLDFFGDNVLDVMNDAIYYGLRTDKGERIQYPENDQRYAFDRAFRILVECLLNSVEVGIVDKPVSIRTFDTLPSISKWLNEPIRVERSEENLEPSM